MSKMLSTPWWTPHGYNKPACNYSWKQESDTQIYLVCAALNVLRGEEGQLFEVWVLGPHGLGDHLSQLHSSQCRTQPAITGEHVDTGLNQTDCLQTEQTGAINIHTWFKCGNMLQSEWGRIRIRTLLRMSSVSDWSSALSCILERWAWSRRFVFTWGSLNLGLFSLWGTFCASWGAETSQQIKVPL